MERLSETKAGFYNTQHFWMSQAITYPQAKLIFSRHVPTSAHSLLLPTVISVPWYSSWRVLQASAPSPFQTAAFLSWQKLPDIWKLKTATVLMGRFPCNPTPSSWNLKWAKGESYNRSPANQLLFQAMSASKHNCFEKYSQFCATCKVMLNMKKLRF